MTKNEYRCFLLFLISNAKMAHIVFVMQIHQAKIPVMTPTY
ncbi:hypothetical protein SFK1770_1842 [Shigella flexneri K-1770]|nr:hypothetical protein SFK1770_1842 [Shigella flexneri K-1770]